MWCVLSNVLSHVSSSNFSAGIAGLLDGRSDVRMPRRATVPLFSQNRPAH